MRSSGRRLGLAALATMAISGAGVAEPLPNFPKDTRYDDARASLRALGWTPVVQRGHDRCARGLEARCARFPETEFCDDTALASCEMLWRHGDRVIEVLTLGEGDRPIAARVRYLAGC